MHLEDTHRLEAIFASHNVLRIGYGIASKNISDLKGFINGYFDNWVRDLQYMADENTICNGIG